MGKRKPETEGPETGVKKQKVTELKSEVEELEKLQSELEVTKQDTRRNLENARTKKEKCYWKNQLIELKARSNVLKEKRLEFLSQLHKMQLQSFFNKLSTELTNYRDNNDWDFLLQSTTTSIIETGVPKLLLFLQRHYGESTEFDDTTEDEEDDEDDEEEEEEEEKKKKG